jgi:hypothetical protein
MVQLFPPPDCHKSTHNHHPLNTLAKKYSGEAPRRGAPFMTSFRHKWAVAPTLWRWTLAAAWMCGSTATFALRVFRASYLRTQFPNTTTNIQNSLSLGAGIVWRFGR